MSEQKCEDKLSDQSMASAHLKERREMRYDIAIEIEVSGIGPDGKAFHQRTVTKDVSEWGCGFLLSKELKVDDMIALRMASTESGKGAPPRQSLFQVLRVKREGEGWLVGAWKMDSGDVWGADLPNSAKSEGSGQESRKEEVT